MKNMFELHRDLSSVLAKKIFTLSSTVPVNLRTVTSLRRVPKYGGQKLEFTGINRATLGSIRVYQ
jgi:hypothetical protein